MAGVLFSVLDYHRMEWKLDIIVPSWNCKDKLIAMVESVRRYTTIPWRMFIHDNASEDGAKEWLLEQAPQDSRLSVTTHPQNLGFSAATNLGIQQSLAQPDSYWTILMNNDIVVTEDWDTRMLDALRRRPRVKAASPVLVRMRGKQHNRHNRGIHWQWDRVIGRWGKNSMVRSDWIGFSCAWIAKDVWRRYGLLRSDGEFWHYGSDEEFCRRIRGSWRVGIYTGVAVWHFHGASRATVHSMRGKRKATERAKRTLIWKLADKLHLAGNMSLETLMVELGDGAPPIEEVRQLVRLWLHERKLKDAVL
jgi:GT2 family glycosyltransferase